jgi:hypothetical protein
MTIFVPSLREEWDLPVRANVETSQMWRQEMFMRLPCFQCQAMASDLVLL